MINRSKIILGKGGGFMSSRFGFLRGTATLVSKRNLQSSNISTPIFSKKRGRRLDDDQPRPFIFVANCGSHRGIDHRFINCGGCQHPLLLEAKRFDLGFLPCFRPRRKPGSGNRGVHVRIAATCNDMLLCHSTHPGDMARRVYYLCNPLTKKWRALPHFCPKPPFMKGVVVGLVCYNEGNDFQVVRIHETMVQVFSSKTNKWLKMKVPEELICDLWNSRLHIMFSWNGTLFYANPKHMFAYNPLESERWHITDTPGELDCKNLKSMAFGVCQGSLQLLQLHTYYEGGFFRVWELKDYEKGEWSLKYKLFFDEIETDDEYLEWELDYDQWQRIDILGLDPNHDGIVYICHSIKLDDDPDPCFVPTRNFACNLRTKEAKLLDDAHKLASFRYTVTLRGWEKYLFQYIIPERPTHVPVLRPEK
ncbi:hypothetical protein Tsubulata_036679 [Turnera subulata]|uniref:F-box associated domain-containing protein n=1 Tax=Turnera subulata TaxID=218843 RepID=A0A9Q0JMK5_9ROSI|nr:hypothetical protein Tsubulata_036679 [Turnera subulata]